MFEITSEPFDWNDNLSEIAQEDFSMIRQNLSYGTATTIGMALAKLELLEKQGCKVVEPQESEDKISRSVIKDIKAEIKQIVVSGQVDEHISFIRTGEQVKIMALDIIDKHCGKENTDG